MSDQERLEIVARILRREFGDGYLAEVMPTEILAALDAYDDEHAEGEVAELQDELADVRAALDARNTRGYELDLKLAVTVQEIWKNRVEKTEARAEAAEARITEQQECIDELKRALYT